eukprot:535797_1
MSTARLDSIISYVEQATTSSDLFTLISHIPLTALQTFVTHHVRNSCNDLDLIDRLYHNALPIDTILPHDLIQNILSFDSLSIAQRAVSQSFKALSDKNLSMELKQRNEIIQDPQFQFNMDFQTGTRWVVDTNKRYLNNEQLALGYKGPFDLQKALQQSQSKDMLLISDGEYTIHGDELFGTKDLSLIGIGDNVLIKLESNTYDSHYLQSQLFFKNIRMESPLYNNAHVCVTIDMKRNSHLWIERCTVSAFCINNCDDSSSLHIKNSCFDGKQLGDKAIDISPSLVVRRAFEIVGCTFTGWGHNSSDSKMYDENPCIEVWCGRDIHECDAKERKQGSIMIVGNIFVNNKGRTIVFYDGNTHDSTERQDNYDALVKSNIVTLYGNICQNKNGRLEHQMSPLQNTDPNKIHFGLREY